MILVPLNKVIADYLKVIKKLRIKTDKEQEILRGIFLDILEYFNPEYSYLHCNTDEPLIKKIYEASNDVKKILLDSSNCFIVICTIGETYHKLSEKYQKDNKMFHVYCLDLIASDTVENLAEYVSKLLLNKFYSDSEYKLTKRFSPGYGDMNLKKQELFFSFFDSKKLSVKLNEAFIMYPEKSISYICGIIKK